VTKRKHAAQEQKWIDSAWEKPITYSLVKMLFESGSFQIGWWDGSKWDNRRGVEKKVIAWKNHTDK
jgi:hypothetical protein